MRLFSRGIDGRDTKAVIEQAYDAFNRRDIDGTLELMTEDVIWPRTSESGRAVGKEEIRAYWTRQWGEFDPHVKPIAIDDGADGRVRVRVHQVVKNLAGDVLLDREVLHMYTMKGGLIAMMEIVDEPDSVAASSGALARES